MPHCFQLRRDDAAADPELAHDRALDALHALEYLYETLPPDALLPVRHVYALNLLAFDAVRAVLRPVRSVGRAND